MIDVFRRRSRGERDVLRRLHLPRLSQGGVVACVCTCGGDVPALQPLGANDSYLGAVALLDALHADVAESEGWVSVATSSDAAARYIQDGTLAVIPALEGAAPVERDLGRLVDLYERGIRVIGLTWNSRNKLAVGLDSGEGGLSEFGARAIEVMNRLGVVVDLAHASSATFWDVARESAAPLVVSHANARAVWDHPRNLDDEQLDAVGSSGGVVGLSLCPSFVSAQPVTLDDVLDHAEYLVRRMGIDSVVVGADFIDYALEEVLGDLRSHGDLYPEGSFTYPAGLETASELQNLVRGFGTRGFDQSDLISIGVSNFLRVAKRTEQVAAVAWVGP